MGILLLQLLAPEDDLFSLARFFLVLFHSLHLLKVVVGGRQILVLHLQQLDLQVYEFQLGSSLQLSMHLLQDPLE